MTLSSGGIDDRATSGCFHLVWVTWGERPYLELDSTFEPQTTGIVNNLTFDPELQSITLIVTSDATQCTGGFHLIYFV